jgi:outer membrane immunogenic protein
LLGTPPASFSSDTKGFIGGGQIGYNCQYVHWVFGAEADFDWTNADGSDTQGQNLFFGLLPATATTSEKLDWLGTVRGRVGYASGNLLVYATGGLAYAKVNDSFSYNVSFLAPPPFFTANGSSSDTRTGWTVGGGAELALDKNWSLKGEYLFYDLGSQNFSAPWSVVGLGAIPGSSFPVETKIDGQIARVGFNYNFH